MLYSPAFRHSKTMYEGGEGYTPHVYTAGGGEGYTLHVCSADVGQRYTLHVQTTYSEDGCTLHIHTDDVLEGFTLHVHTASRREGYTLQIHTACSRKGYTITSTLLVVESKTRLCSFFQVLCSSWHSFLFILYFPYETYINTIFILRWKFSCWM
jgi:hypothetical protein